MRRAQPPESLWQRTKYGSLVGMELLVAVINMGIFTLVHGSIEDWILVDNTQRKV